MAQLLSLGTQHEEGWEDAGLGGWGSLEAVPPLGLEAPLLGSCVCGGAGGGICMGPWGLLTRPGCLKPDILQQRPPCPHCRWALRVPWDPFDDSADAPVTPDIQLMGNCFPWPFSLGNR